MLVKGVYILNGFALVGIAVVGVLLMVGCGEAANPSVPMSEGGAAVRSTEPAVPELTMAVGTSVSGGGNVTGDPLVPRDASGSPLPQTPTVMVDRVLTPDAWGLVRVTLDDGYQPVVEMAVGETLELALGEVYEWGVTVGDTSILGVQAMSPVGGASQGLYKAKKAGQTSIEANGEPLCSKANPPCGMPYRGTSPVSSAQAQGPAHT